MAKKISKLFYFKGTVSLETKLQILKSAIAYIEKNNIDDIVLTTGEEFSGIYTINNKEL